VIVLKATVDSALKERHRVSEERKHALEELRCVRAEWRATIQEVRCRGYRFETDL
jgi:hypothetical protein